MKKLIFFFILSHLSITCNFAQDNAQPAPGEQELPSLVGTIEDINMASLPRFNNHFSTESYSEYLQWYLKERLTPNCRFRRHMMFTFYKRHQPFEISDSRFNSNFLELKTVWRNLNLFCGDTQQDNYVATKIDRTSTEIGKVTLMTMLAQPTRDSACLEKRQAVIAHLMSQTDLLSDVDKILKALKKAEPALLALWDHDHFQQSAQKCYFELLVLKELNVSKEVLLGRSAYEHATRVTGIATTAFAGAVLLAYGVAVLSHAVTVPNTLDQWANQYKDYSGSLLRYAWLIDNNVMRGFLGLIGAAYCGMHVKQNYEWAAGMFLLEEVIHKIMNEVTRFIKTASLLYAIIKSDPVLALYEEFQGLTDFFEKEMMSQEHLKEFVELCDTSTFEGDPSVFSHKGNVLRAHALMYEQKEKLVALIQGLARFDVYCGLARLMNEHERLDHGFCFPAYTTSDKPFVSCHEFWHPMIDRKKVVANSIDLGVNGARSNMIITGPNAGGKSSTLKALAISLWMAQTLGIAPAQQLEFTPFHNIQTYLNITDDVGVGNSLFKAEVLRTQKLIDTIKKSGEGEYSFVVFDEVFNGTSPVEGAAAAYSVAKQLSVFNQSISLIATHFPLLTKLEQDTLTFSNYKVTVDVYRNGSIAYPFKLYKGIADQHVALQILRNEGFEGSLIDEAEKLVYQME